MTSRYCLTRDQAPAASWPPWKHDTTLPYAGSIIEPVESFRPTMTSDAKIQVTWQQRAIELGEFVDETIAALRLLAKRDHHVTALLDTLAQRMTDRDDLLETGMIVEYNNA